MADDWMTDALEGFQGNPVAQAYARQRAEDERRARLAAAMVAWLREQIAEDRRIAEAANSGPWHVDNQTFAESIYSADDTCVIGGGRWGGEASVFDSNEDALHIVRHDPRAVLARCDAYTAILDRWVIGAGIPENKISSFIRGQDDGYQQGCLDAIRDLAVSMADRDGFREEWRSA